jgi:hypothetical protein
MGRKAIDISNQPFGKLTALHQDGKNDRGEIKWACKCACGRTCSFSGKSLRSGAIEDCGQCDQPKPRKDDPLRANVLDGYQRMLYLDRVKPIQLAGKLVAVVGELALGMANRSQQYNERGIFSDLARIAGTVGRLSAINDLKLSVIDANRQVVKLTNSEEIVFVLSSAAADVHFSEDVEYTLTEVWQLWVALVECLGLDVDDILRSHVHSMMSEAA